MENEKDGPRITRVGRVAGTSPFWARKESVVEVPWCQSLPTVALELANDGGFQVTIAEVEENNKLKDHFISKRFEFKITTHNYAQDRELVQW